MFGGSCEKWQLASHDHMIIWWAARAEPNACSFVQETWQTFLHVQVIPATFHQVRLANFILLPLRLLCKFLRKRVLQRARITTYIVSVDPLLDIAGSVHHVVHYDAFTGSLEVSLEDLKLIKRAGKVSAPALKYLAHAINASVRSVEVFAVHGKMV